MLRDGTVRRIFSWLECVDNAATTSVVFLSMETPPPTIIIGSRTSKEEEGGSSRTRTRTAMMQRSCHYGLLSTCPAFVLQLVVLVLFLSLAKSEDKEVNDDRASSLPAATTHTCYQVVDWLRDNTPLSLASPQQQQPPPPLLTIHVHRNGEATSCGTAAGITGLDLIQAILRRGENCAAFDAYVLESVLTDAIYRRLTTTTTSADAASSMDACRSVVDGEDVAPGLAGYCDMGVARTVEQPDFDHLVRLPGTDTLPCRWRTRAGVRIATLAQLLPETATSTTASMKTTPTTLDLYGVPAGRQFHFSPSHVGDVIDLPHLCPSCRLSVLSVTPAIFELHDFLTDDDAAELLGPSAYFEGRSVIAFNEANPNAKNYRTSETGYLTNAAYQAALQQRALNLLGMADDSGSSSSLLLRQHVIAEGPQLLRYNATAAYIPHLDYMEDLTGRRRFNFDSAGTGSNRYATILFYLNDVAAGGETIFTKAVVATTTTPPPDEEKEDPQQLQQAIIRDLRASLSPEIELEHGSWQENMTATCRSSGFAVKPRRNKAILFYNQHPDGTVNRESEHGACPVLGESKLAANLWIWSNDHPASPHAPMRSFETTNAIRAIFRNTRRNDEYENAVLYYGNVKFQPVGYADPPDFGVDTYPGHRWHIKVNGQIRQSFVIKADATTTTGGETAAVSEIIFEF